MQKPIHADSERGSTNKACDFHVTLFGHEDELEEEITPSDSGSVVSGPTSKSKSCNGYLTPPSASSSKKSLSLSVSSALSRSVSPFRRFARKLTGGGKSPSVSKTPLQQSKAQRAPASAPRATLRHRSSLFALTSQPSMPTTPERLGHKYS